MFDKHKYKIANATGIPYLFHYLNRKKSLVLTYHGLFDGSFKTTGDLPATFVHVDNFIQQMAFIKKKYRIISPQYLLDCIKGKKNLPEYAALITFDDGYESFYRLAWPVLKSMDIPAVVFVPTRYLEDRKPFWFDIVWMFLKKSSAGEIEWLYNILKLKNEGANLSTDGHGAVFNTLKKLSSEKRDAVINELASNVSEKTDPDDQMLKLFFSMTDEQIKKLSDQNIYFGGHTHTHTILTSMDYGTVKKEIETNKLKLEKITGKPCELFAYPNGGADDFDENHKRILKEAGFEASFSLTYRRSDIFKDLMEISRINVNPEDTIESFDFHSTGIVQLLNMV